MQDRGITGLVPSEAEKLLPASLLGSGGVLAVVGIPVHIVFSLYTSVSVPNFPHFIGKPIMWN